ncbi:hypothetical protein [Nonomuraea indica]|uniref:Uncharacterized protein n=1 Tax=Nonomuraea indica TaxID=1581193 RepID=A0ABW8AEE7_9ACTN
MSNIFTDFIRVYAQPGHHIDEVEAQWIAWMLLGPRGSYHVPVRVRCGPQGRYAEIQYGSGKSPDVVNFCENHIGYWRYSTIWGRSFNDGGSEDVIWQDDVNDGPRRFCRYGFDEVRVITAGGQPPVVPEAPWQRQLDGSWRLRVAGSYRTGNDRFASVGPCATVAVDPPAPDPADLPVSTPTTPNIHGEELSSIDPPWLAALTEAVDPRRSDQERRRLRLRRPAGPAPASPPVPPAGPANPIHGSCLHAVTGPLAFPAASRNHGAAAPALFAIGPQPWAQPEKGGAGKAVTIADDSVPSPMRAGSRVRGGDA